MATDDITRDAALHLLKTGQATLSEVAGLADASRQLVRYWANYAEIDATQARADRLARLWAKALKRSA